MNTEIINLLQSLSSSQISNYIVPGLTSDMLGLSMVRMFTMEREQHEFVTPHTHRFDFACLVLHGEVENTVWSITDDKAEKDLYAISRLIFGGEPGVYTQSGSVTVGVTTETTCYGEGEWYHMKHNEFHSIKFKRGTRVLFFEGQKVTNVTQILQPVVSGKVVPTFEVQPWMFKP